LPYIFTRASFREGACALRAAGGQVRFLNKCFRSQLNSLLPPGHRVSTRHSVLRTHHSSLTTHHFCETEYMSRSSAKTDRALPLPRRSADASLGPEHP